MRMAKRIAVSLLAAAMALSMLTACGGGGNANSGGTSGGSGGGSNNSSNTGSSDNGSSGNNGASNKDDKNDLTTSNDLTKLPDGTEIDYADSQTRKWNKMCSSGKLYMVTEDSSSQSQKRITEMARDGKNTYRKTTYEGSRGYETLYDGNAQVSYTLYPNVKIATTSVFSDSSSGTTSGERCSMTMKKTTRVEENVPYYAEIQTLTGQTTGRVYETIYCYDSTGALAYQISNPGTENEMKSHVLKYSTSIPNTAILEIPSDWEIYTFIYGKDGILEKVTTPDGHELTNEEYRELYNKIYS